MEGPDAVPSDVISLKQPISARKRGPHFVPVAYHTVISTSLPNSNYRRTCLCLSIARIFFFFAMYRLIEP